MQQAVLQILEKIGEDPTREALRDTPQRVADSWMELTRGYREDLTTLLQVAVFAHPSQQMVVIKNMEIYSLCEHHLLPFFGRCHIAYIPNGKILGLSKFAVLVDHFARRLQVQERLTDEIAAAIEEILQPQGIAVHLEAQHLCMMMRGVEKQQSSLVTSCMKGKFLEEAALRQDFFQALQIGS